jgi:alanyl aminopeptidase
MENPGLITFGSTLLLSGATGDSIHRRRSFVSTLVHELAHQWFGNLVTAAWWDDIWLNESFAEHVMLDVTASWKPEWEIGLERVSTRIGAMSSDSLTSARRIREPIVTNDDIANAFDGITYGKGASVIDMFEAWVGRETFQRGVRSYLAKHAWGNATATDFLAAISEAAGKDVATPFRTFLDQPGAPVVRFELSCPTKGPPSLALSQKRALPVGSTGDAAKTWQVPLCVRWSAKGKEGRACTLLAEEKGALPLEGACPDWLVPNAGYEGYFRAHLEGPLSLVDTFRQGGGAVSASERIGLLDDVSALVRSGELDLSVSLTAAELASRANDRYVLGSALALASQPGDDLLPEKLRGKHEAWVRALFSKKLATLGLTPKKTDDEDTRLLRTDLIATLGWVGKDAALQAEARKRTEAWLVDRKAAHPDVLNTFVLLAGYTADAALHEKLLVAAKAETDRGDRGRLIGAVAETNDRAMVKAQLPLVLTQTFDTREAMRLLWGAAGNFSTRDLAMEFLQTHWDTLMTLLPKDSGARLVWLSDSFCDARSRDDVKAFFDGRSTKYLGGPRNFALAMESIDLCIAWRARQRDSAIAFFEKRK